MVVDVVTLSRADQQTSSNGTSMKVGSGSGFATSDPVRSNSLSATASPSTPTMNIVAPSSGAASYRSIRNRLACGSVIILSVAILFA